MRTYYIAQGTLLNALCWAKWEGNFLKGGRIYIYIYISDSSCTAENTKTL